MSLRLFRGKDVIQESPTSEELGLPDTGRRNNRNRRTQFVFLVQLVPMNRVAVQPMNELLELICNYLLQARSCARSTNIKRFIAGACSASEYDY